jgi:23S rRNA (uracil1939-C5)-methyltransferase
LYALGTQRVLPIDHCPQLEPQLDLALQAVRAAAPPDGELAMVIGHAGDVAIGVQAPWRNAKDVVGRNQIRGVVTPEARFGTPLVEIEPELSVEPWDFAQASAAGNDALIARARAAVGKGPGKLLELFAGGGNFTRAFIVDDWDVIASDAVAPARTLPIKFEVGAAADVLARVQGPLDVIVLDPPRSGAAECVDGIAKLAPSKIVYISCDPATLARDAERLVSAGYRATDAWPVDLMPQTAHVEVVMRFAR